ncbi:MAG: YqaA family protein [Bacillota bacterium]
MTLGYNLLASNERTLLDTISRLLQPVLEFFLEYGELGLFLYSIIETITPMAGVEFILIPVLLSSPAERWWFIALNITVANTIGAFIVFFFMSKGENKMYNKVVNKRNQERAKKLFDRYGFWAIFIFAMTPLPFFVILFTASIAKMKFGQYIIAAFLSRGTRFLITSYAVVYLGSQANVIFWLAIVGVGGALIMMFIQRKLLEHFENKANMSSEEVPADEVPKKS